MIQAATDTTQGKPKQRARKPARTPRTRKPEHMTLEEWQIALRREFGRAQKFRLKNLGEEPVFSDFHVYNPVSERTYRVSVRGRHPGDNFCTCPDFSVNTLGTCKHIEFTLAKIERKSGGKEALRQGFKRPYSEVYLRYGARREVIFRPGTEITASVQAQAARYFDEQGVLRPEAYASFESLLKLGGGAHETRCYDDAAGFVAQVRDAARLAQRIDAAFPQGQESAAFEGLLKVPLYPYQRAGALFAAKAGRALLADDMGLGKTIQAIAAIEILARTAGIERVLVITPTSLKHQWKEEIGKFSNRAVEVIEGLLAQRSVRYASASFYKIVNYDVIHRDTEAIRRWAPDLIVLDEAQRIKNWKTRAARTVKQLPSQFAIVLTGTPLENRLEELHSIVAFVDRFRLGPAFRFLAEHQHTDQTGRVVGYRNLDKITQTLKPILLRRTKDTVLKELPARLEKHFFVSMTPQQWQHHEENREIVARIVHKWRKYGFLSDADQKRLTCALQNMRMSCNSTFLLDHATDYGVKADEIGMLLGEWLEQPGAKAVVFSQWVRSHELLASRLRKRDLDFVLFHGGIPGPKRKDLLTRFREDPRCRVFLSTDAGGVGLNLQHASAVINVDQPWNPAVLEQRIGRVHRLGQRRPVQVAHFVAEGTIEHGMLDLLKFKRSLFAGVLDGGEQEVFLGGTRLKKFMDSVEKATQAIPAATPDTVVPLPDIEAAQAADEEDEDSAAVKPARSGSAEPAAAATAAATETARAAERGDLPAGAGWTELVAAGRAFLDNLERALQPGTAQPGDADRGSGQSTLLERDASTGQTYLKLPLPSPGAIQTIAVLMSALTGRK
ncbi:MAG: DEAD/DEAH box helicase [Planctomycetota bacterium]